MHKKYSASLSLDSSMIATRIVPLEGIYNLRDMGGFPAMHGRHVKWRQVYRSDELACLSGADLQQLYMRNIKTVVDFRTGEERQRAPNRLPECVKQVLELEIIPGNLIDLSMIHEGNAVQIMLDLNRALVHAGQSAYRTFFNALKQDRNAPLLFNCAAGKDRTGLAAALFLSSLGVARELIMEDYLLSAITIRKKYDFFLNDQPWLEPLVTVRHTYLEAAFDEIDKHFGGINTYLESCLGADIPRLQEIFTE